MNTASKPAVLAGKQRPGSDGGTRNPRAGKPVTEASTRRASRSISYQTLNLQEFGTGGPLGVKINKVAHLLVVTLFVSLVSPGASKKHQEIHSSISCLQLLSLDNSPVDEEGL